MTKATREEMLALADQQAYARSRYNEDDTDLIRESKVIEWALRAAAPPEGVRAETLADRILSDPKVVWLRECGFNSSARFEAELRAAIMRTLSPVAAGGETEPMPEVWEEWHLEKPGQPAHIVIVDTHRQPVPSAVARAYWLAKIDREYPL